HILYNIPNQTHLDIPYLILVGYEYQLEMLLYDVMQIDKYNLPPYFRLHRALIILFLHQYDSLYKVLTGKFHYASHSTQFSLYNGFDTLNYMTLIPLLSHSQAPLGLGNHNIAFPHPSAFPVHIAHK